MEVSKLRSGRLSKKKKNYPFNAAWTSECSWRATVAPAGWTSSGLRAPHTGGWAGGPDGTCGGHWLIKLLKKNDYIPRFVHVILAPVHAILLCIIQANYVRHPYAGALLSSARADVEIFLRRHCRRRGKKTGKSSGQCTVEIPVQSTAREFHTSLPYRRTSPLVNIFRNPAIHSSKLHTQKKRRVISGAMLLKKKHNMCSFCTCPSLVHVIASHFAPGPC